MNGGFFAAICRNFTKSQQKMFSARLFLPICRVTYRHVSAVPRGSASAVNQEACRVKSVLFGSRSGGARRAPPTRSMRRTGRALCAEGRRARPRRRARLPLRPESPPKDAALRPRTPPPSAVPVQAETVDAQGFPGGARKPRPGRPLQHRHGEGAGRRPDRQDRLQGRADGKARATCSPRSTRARSRPRSTRRRRRSSRTTPISPTPSATSTAMRRSPSRASPRSSSSTRRRRWSTPTPR